MRRLPSFNDFSPGIIGDIRRPLEIVHRLAPDMDAVIAEWDRVFFKGAGKKRAITNIPTTLDHLGLMTRGPFACLRTGSFQSMPGCTSGMLHPEGAPNPALMSVASSQRALGTRFASTLACER